MDLATELAILCVVAQEEKRADVADPVGAQPNLVELRNRFETLANKEELLRTHAQRWQDLGAERADREDTSLGGYASTALSRTLPIPHTGLEAAIRLPLIAGAGALGYSRANKHGPLDPQELERISKPLSAKDTGFSNRLREVWVNSLPDQARMDARSSFGVLDNGKGPDKLLAEAKLGPGWQRYKDLVSRLSMLPGEDLSRILQTPEAGRFTFVNKTLQPTDIAARKEISEVFGRNGIGAIRNEAASAIRNSSKNPLSSVTPSRTGLKGGLAAAGIATILTALPWVANALWQKHKGGEGAARARAEAEAKLQLAEQAAQEREGILGQLPAGAGA